MQPIPQPHLLDPDRVLDNDRNHLTADHETRARLLEQALHESCSYAQQLWDNLDTVRAYLMDSLPPDPRSPEPHQQTGAAPTGPDDTAGWDNWIGTYANVTSALCGPHGDSGFGLGEARREATLRRSAPSLRVHAAHPDLDRTQPTTSALQEQSEPATAVGPNRSRKGRTAASAVLILLALRGLRPRRLPHADKAAKQR